MSFASLPTELLDLIAAHITSTLALGALSLVNRRLHIIFDALLYQHDASSAQSHSKCCKAVLWAAQHGMMPTLHKALHYGAKISKSNPCMDIGIERIERKVHGFQVCWGFEHPPLPHPLCSAVEGGHIEIVEFLLDELKCDVDMVDSEGVSILSLAVIHDHVQLVEALLSRGANQYTRHLVVRSPIEFAALPGKREMVDILYLCGARHSIWYSTENEVQSALGCAIEMDHREIVRLLVEYGAPVVMAIDPPGGAKYGDVTPFEWAVEIGDIKMVELLLSKGAKPSYTERPMRCALVRAVRRQDQKIACLIISHSTCLQKTLALAFAAEQADGYFARFLLSHGTHPDFDEVEYEAAHRAPDLGYTTRFIPPLVRAVHAGHVHLVKLLVEYGANVSISYDGFTECRSSRWRGSVLQLAMDLADEGIISFLREHGAQEKVQPYHCREWVLSMEERRSSEGKRKTRMRLRRHMGVNSCCGSMTGPVSTSPCRPVNRHISFELQGPFNQST
ncbi:ankyrin repeat-containing domain protein [Aspergillus germanicus]